MKNKLSHEDEKRYGEQGEGCNGRKDPCYHSDKARYPSQEEIGGNHIDNEKGKGNRYPREQQEDHAAKKQTDDRVPFHGLPPCLNVIKLAPGHPEELDGEEDAAYRDDDENDPFRNGNRPYVGHIVHDGFNRVGNAKIDHNHAGTAGYDEHDTIEILLGFFIEVGIYDIGSDMSSLSQKPGCSEEDYPEQRIFGCLHDPYSRPCEQEPHADGVADSGTYEYEYYPCHGSHNV